METRSKFTTEQIESVRAKLKDLPAIEKIKKEYNKSETIKMLSREINTLQKRGYSLDQISDYLRGEGLEIGTPTLRSYMQRAMGGKQKVQDKKDTPPPSPQTQRKEVDASKAYFTPRPDTDDI